MKKHDKQITNLLLMSKIIILWKKNEKIYVYICEIILLYIKL